MRLNEAIQKHIERGTTNDPNYEKNFWDGYEQFKIGVMLKQARSQTGMTQEEIAKKLKTTRSAISRIENHSKDVKLSTLEKFAEALGKKLIIAIE